MKQRETELYGKRIDDAMNQRKLLQLIDPTKTSSVVKPGALVTTGIGIFFIAISTDEIVIDDVEYCIISIDSPIGQAMNGKSSGESFLFRGKSVKISDIC